MTGLLAVGENVLGAVLGRRLVLRGSSGSTPSGRARTTAPPPNCSPSWRSRYADGSQEVIGTDAGWQGRFAAIRHADLLMGERHDLRLEPDGWDSAGFDPDPGAAGWRAVRCRDRDGRPLVADPGPPVRVTEEITPVRHPA